MTVSLSFNNYNNYQINESRVNRMMNSDREEATHMGLWDKFKDIFRTEKKADALNELYNSVHGDGGVTKLGAFEKLKNFSGAAHKDLFKIEMQQDGIACRLDQDRVCDITFTELMNIEGNVSTTDMSSTEKDLFLLIVKELAKTEASREGLIFNALRAELCNSVRSNIYAEYRPTDENMGKETIPWAFDNNLKDYKYPKEILSLNAGTFDPTTQLAKVGFKGKGDELEVNMVHPLIYFMLHTYNKDPDTKEANTQFLNILKEDYQEYNDNKKTIDTWIKDILIAHDMNPYIEKGSGSRNHLC